MPLVASISFPTACHRTCSRPQVVEDGSDSGHEGDEFVKEQQNEWLCWKEHSLKTRFKLDMEKHSAPWTSDHQLRGLVPTSPRVLDVVQVAYWAWLRGQKGGAAHTKANPQWLCDATQSVHRAPWGGDPMSFNQFSKIYSFEFDRVLDVEDPALRHVMCERCRAQPHMLPLLWGVWDRS